jgi:hypothetical protein
MKATIYFIFSFLFVFSNFISSTEVLYCTPSDTVGFFRDKETKEYRFSKFIPLERFTMSFTSGDYSNLVLNDPVNVEKVKYICRDENTYDKKNNLYCQEVTTVGAFTFLFSVEKRKFTWFRGSLYGYPTDGSDDTTISIGTCEDF